MDAAVRRGDDVLVDVVVRTRKVGHFFPGGTVDAFDVWLELQATDDKGQTIFWSGKVEDDGKGPVEPGAHFYKSLQIDEHGNPINKRNAWASRAVVYVHLIPPGAADTVHFRMHVPENAGEHITLHAKLNYRKFQWWNTQFAFAGKQDPAIQSLTSRRTTTIANGVQRRSVACFQQEPKRFRICRSSPWRRTRRRLRVLPQSAAAPQPQVALVKEDWTRWNDYGIGLFLQGDLKGAEQAFDENYGDGSAESGWLDQRRPRARAGRRHGGRERGPAEGAGAEAGPGAGKFLLCARVEGRRQIRRSSASACKPCWRNIRATAWCTTNWAACCSCKNATPMR